MARPRTGEAVVAKRVATSQRGAGLSGHSDAAVPAYCATVYAYHKVNPVRAGLGPDSRS